MYLYLRMREFLTKAFTVVWGVFSGVVGLTLTDGATRLTHSPVHISVCQRPRAGSSRLLLLSFFFLCLFEWKRAFIVSPAVNFSYTSRRSALLILVENRIGFLSSDGLWEFRLTINVFYTQVATRVGIFLYWRSHWKFCWLN